MMFDRLTELCDLARTIGWQAADILHQAETNFDVEKSGDSPVTSADLAANRCILDGLQSALGLTEFAYLSDWANLGSGSLTPWMGRRILSKAPGNMRPTLL
jgi:3'-phosphoadenosine 5'-phosphosulfate (PAPS) 3'-phosphatase